MVGKVLGKVVIAPSTEVGSTKDCWKEVIVEGALLVWVSALRESLSRALTLQVELKSLFLKPQPGIVSQPYRSRC